jgi:CheY-like chemotaxis protein
MDNEQKSIVVIDDDRMIREMLTVGCQAVGHQVATYASGIEALENFAGDSPDFVLIDYDLPDVSGLEVARQLRSVTNGNASLVLAMLTGAVPSDISEINQSKIFDHILIKPVSIVRLQKLIESS